MQFSRISCLFGTMPAIVMITIIAGEKQNITQTYASNVDLKQPSMSEFSCRLYETLMIFDLK